jgi:hypothetical protein
LVPNQESKHGITDHLTGPAADGDSSTAAWSNFLILMKPSFTATPYPLRNTDMTSRERNDYPHASRGGSSGY